MKNNKINDSPLLHPYRVLHSGLKVDFKIRHSEPLITIKTNNGLVVLEAHEAQWLISSLQDTLNILNEVDR